MGRRSNLSFEVVDIKQEESLIQTDTTRVWVMELLPMMLAACTWPVGCRVFFMGELLTNPEDKVRLIKFIEDISRMQIYVYDHQ